MELNPNGIKNESSWILRETNEEIVENKDYRGKENEAI